MMEEELNPPPKSYRPSYAMKILFMCLAMAGVFGYAYMIIQRRLTQARFIENNQMAAIKLQKMAMPNLKIIDPENYQEKNLYDFLGQKWTLLNVWATWCAPCQEEMPSLALLAKKLEQKLNIIALSMDDDASKVKEFIKTQNPSFKVLWDQEKSAAKMLGLNKYPETFLISPDGILRIQFSGPRDWASKAAIDYLEKSMDDPLRD